MTNKNIKTYLLTCAAIVLLAAISCFLGGIVQLAAGILISVLLGLQTVKYHYGYVVSSALLLFLVPLVITALLSGTDFSSVIVYTVLLTFPIILMGLTLGFSANMKISFYKTVVILAVIYLAGTVTNMKILSSTSSAFNIENIIADSIGQFQTMLDSVYSSNPDALNLISTLLGDIAKMMLTLTPAVFTLLSTGIAFICSMIFKTFCLKQQIDISFWPPFYKLRADRFVSVLFLVIFIINTFAPDGLFADLTLNVIVILSGIFLLFGLSFLDWTLRSRGMKRLPRRLILIACVPLCTSFFMLPLLILVSLGMIDGLLNFRTRKPPRAF